MSERLPLGTKIAGFQVIDVLGQGGFGITYKSRNLRTGDFAAIKEFFPSDYATRDSDMSLIAKPGNSKFVDMGLKAFLDEAEILRDLPNQPGLVRVQAAFRKHGTAYCVMDYIKGDTLSRMVPRLHNAYGHVPETLVRALVSSMGSALHAVHDAGLIHRDVKPANVMIRVDGQPVLIDFGAARPLERRAAAGAAMFTRSYAALEQFPREAIGLNRSIPETPKSDIFAMAVVLYEMVSASLPATADERFKAIKASGKDIYVPVRENLARNRVPADYSDKLLDLIDAGCELIPDDRPSDARSFVAALDDDGPRRGPAAKPKPDQGVKPKPDAPRPKASEGKQKPAKVRRRRRGGGGLTMLLIMLFLAAVAIIFGYLTRVQL
jgi:serine/threonine protein kinase